MIVERLRGHGPTLRIVRMLILRELRARYKVTVLGFLWSLLRPILLALILTVVFSLFLRFEIPYRVPYGFFLIAALLPWTYFAGSLNDAAVSFVSNAGLIRKVYFPRIVFPVVAVGANLVNFLLGIAVIFGGLYLFGVVSLSWNLLALPAVVGIHTLWALGLAIVCSTANVYFRDTAMLLEFGLQAWFYFTPVFYPVSFPLAFLAERGFPDWLYPILNPMVPIVYAYRWCLLGGVAHTDGGDGGSRAWEALEGFREHWGYYLGASLLAAVVVLAASVAVYRRLRGAIADEV